MAVFGTETTKPEREQTIEGNSGPAHNPLPQAERPALSARSALLIINTQRTA
jgi:hypothetical protein